MNELAKTIHKQKYGDRNSQLYYLACLKKIGELGKRIYKLNPNDELKHELIQLSKKIQNYEFH